MHGELHIKNTHMHYVYTYGLNSTEAIGLATREMRWDCSRTLLATNASFVLHFQARPVRSKQQFVKIINIIVVLESSIVTALPEPMGPMQCGSYSPSKLGKRIGS